MPEDNTQTLEMSDTSTDSTDAVEVTEGKAYSEDEVQNLLKALKSEREARKIYEKEVKEKAAQLEKFAQINPDEYRKLQEEASIAAREKAAADERTSLLEEKYGGQAADAAKRAEAANRELQEFRKRYALEKVFFAAGGRTDAADGVSFFDMLANQIGSQFRLEPDGNVTVIDSAGDPILDKASGRRISPEDYLGQFKNHLIYGTFFKGNKGSGAGIGYGGTDANGMMGEDLTTLSRDELFQRAFG
jgi:DNA-directed RNA polymerase subunit F